MAVQWKNLPKQIQRRMHECQKEQNNPPLEFPFIEKINKDDEGGGFCWSKTKEGFTFWNSILFDGKIDYFYTIYPKEIIEYHVWI